MLISSLPAPGQHPKQRRKEIVKLLSVLLFRRLLPLSSPSIALLLLFVVALEKPLCVILSSFSLGIHHVRSTANSYEPANLQGQAKGCPRGTQAVEKKGGCIEGTTNEKSNIEIGKAMLPLPYIALGTRGLGYFLLSIVRTRTMEARLFGNQRVVYVVYAAAHCTISGCYKKERGLSDKP